MNDSVFGRSSEVLAYVWALWSNAVVLKSGPESETGPENKEQRVNVALFLSAQPQKVWMIKQWIFVMQVRMEHPRK